ncbi:ATP-binding protein [uncultured Sphingomonas sp.]|uniref:two-component system sensor histidine kinase NtrB n=1 Tax=uncultured Sphingomonas sp. TaxID=158754 RepID=UPI0025ECC428|nr:ATP-binding protein [uncultured Sphingomonas sp.]
MDDQGGRINPPGGKGAGQRVPADALLTALPTPLLVLDEQGVIVDANAAAEALMNLSRTAMAGMTIAEATGHHLKTMPSETPFVAYDLDIMLPHHRALKGDLVVAPLPNWPGWRQVAIHPRPSAGPIARRAGAGLTAAGAAAMLAHEIKNPLSGIRGAAQLLESSIDDNGQVLTRLICDEVDRVAALIDRMEGFTDTRPLELTAQNIHAILGHARAVSEQGFGSGVTIREKYDPSLPSVLGHRDSLIQILINLLKNAAEAVEPNGGTVTLTTAYRHGMRVLTDRGDGRRSLPIEVCVIDDGPGAPPEIAEHLFDPFVSSKRSGRGLGLALVEKLVADQGGMVEYAREARDGGADRTVFRLLLPRAART